ncbi:hypothetical protein VNO77_27305 [Canavalia gladiata]|uniref:Uncharacterized protein n=1 Tax=Canavalia gladiata TaxID=3824 RepID=A0AAN9Q425_CANGL
MLIHEAEQGYTHSFSLPTCWELNSIDWDSGGSEQKVAPYTGSDVHVVVVSSSLAAMRGSPWKATDHSKILRGNREIWRGQAALEMSEREKSTRI